MNKILFRTLAALTLMITSCATPPPPLQAYHHVDSSALVIASLDEKTCRLLQPPVVDTLGNNKALEQAKSLPQHQTAVVILENYNEPMVGNGFRNRSTPLFMGLRTLGYEHIIFLQGKGVNDPEGLMQLAKYD